MFCNYDTKYVLLTWYININKKSFYQIETFLDNIIFSNSYYICICYIYIQWRAYSATIFMAIISNSYLLIKWNTFLNCMYINFGTYLKYNTVTWAIITNTRINSINISSHNVDTNRERLLFHSLSLFSTRTSVHYSSISFTTSHKNRAIHSIIGLK